MRRRHEALAKVHSLLLEKKFTVEQMFAGNKTTHADLVLSWACDEVQNMIGPKETYDVLMATVEAGHVSNAHLHEIGASSFVVLGPKVGLPEPTGLIYRTGALAFPGAEVAITDEVVCHEGQELDIPSYQVHQFENKSSQPAYIVIVAHPVISIEEGEEDIHFVIPAK